LNLPNDWITLAARGAARSTLSARTFWCASSVFALPR
jgi:hypothetical protein